MKPNGYAFNPFRVPCIKTSTVKQDIQAPKPVWGTAFNGNTIKLGRHA